MRTARTRDHVGRRTCARALTALVTALALVVTALPSGPGAAAAAIPKVASACQNGWRELPVPDEAFQGTAFEVLTIEGEPAWIVGGLNNGLLALRWDGASWIRAASTTRGHRGIVGATILDEEQLLGVGYYRPSRGDGEGSLKPISGRIVAEAWMDQPVPTPPGSRAGLTDVTALPDGSAWAVGTRLEDGRLRAYAVRWTGSAWLRREPPAGTGSGLTAVEQTPAGKVWAVGWKENGPGRPGPYIVKRGKKGWVKVKAPPIPGTSAVLTDLAFRSAREGYAVGYRFSKGSDEARAFLIGWDGASWARRAMPWADDFSALPRSVSVGADGQLWIAGTQPANDTREARGFVAQRVAGDWHINTLGVPSDLRSEVMAVGATVDGAVAAGLVGGSLLVLETCSEASPSPARRRGGITRAKVKVGNLKARRQSVRALDRHPPEDHALLDGESSRGRPSPSATGIVTLPPAVKPEGFTVIDMAAASGLAQTTSTYDGFAADFDGNGYSDVFYSRHGMVDPRLAMNGPDGFVNAPTSAFSSVDRHGCDVADVDRDGARDILCAVGAARGKIVNRHELSLAPDKDRRRLVRGGLGISDPLGRGRYVAFLRLDDDRYPEVFIANAPDRDDGLPGYNRFYRNRGGSFFPAPGVGLDTSHGAECVEASDVDQDGDDDLVYCTQYGFNGRAAGLRFMRNEKGVLRDRTTLLGISPMGDIDVAFADVSGDGRKDLIQLSPSWLRVSKRTRDGYRRVYEVRIPGAWALAAGDVSGDGRADIYIARGDDSANKPDRLLISAKQGRAFVSVLIPQTTEGSADDVFALDHDRNGLTDFVVLNGRISAGPVQLLAAFPDP